MGNVRPSDTRCASKRRVLGVSGSDSLGTLGTHGRSGSADKSVRPGASPSLAAAGAGGLAGDGHDAGGQICPLRCAWIPPSARRARHRQARQKGKLLFYNSSSLFGRHKPCLSEPNRTNSSQFWPDRCRHRPVSGPCCPVSAAFLRRDPETISGQPGSHAGKFVRRTFLSPDWWSAPVGAVKQMPCRLPAGGGVVMRDSPWSRAMQQRGKKIYYSAIYTNMSR